jgi:prepilin-type N-terminal cleavage/methylation domain-containing protein
MIFFQKGFTLIELVVSVGLMALLVGGSIAGYNRFNERQGVIQAGKEFVSVLRLAQKRASVGDKPDVAGCNGGEKLDGYRVQASQNDSAYTLSPVCGGAVIAAAETSYSISNQLMFHDAVNLQFQVLSMGVQNGVGGGGAATIEIGSDSSPGFIYIITVSPAGEISEGGISDYVE